MTAFDLNLEQKDEGFSLSAPVIMELIAAVHEKGVPFRFNANGYSMTPAIRDGDTITLSPLKDLLPRRGDVFAFRHSNQLQMLVHRILRKKGDRFFIKGDNCSVADGWIPAENLLGIVTRVERQGKNVFWPDRKFVCARCYFRLYIFWPPVRRLLVKGYRFLKK